MADVVAPVRIDPRYHDAVLFDLDGVITDTASLHQAAWKELFDDYLRRRGPSHVENHGPFTPADYRHFIDGKPEVSLLVPKKLIKKMTHLVVVDTTPRPRIG